MTQRNRDGWPAFAVERVECANCGTLRYHQRESPERYSVKFEKWLLEIMPYGRTMQTRVGFKIWCSARCQHNWERANAALLSNFSPSTAYNKLRREMQRRTISAEEYAR
jgi:rRNA maturation protein Nop10